MEMTHLKGKLFAGIAAVSLAACAFAVPAFAAEGLSKDAEVTVQKDAGQVDWTVPTKIPFVTAADGTTIAPSEKALQIANNSDFAIHVTNVRFFQRNDQINLVGQNDPMTANNSLWFTMKTGSTTVDAKNASDGSGVDVSKDKNFNMGYAGSQTNSIGIDAQGKIAHVSLDLSEPQLIGNVIWTVAPGAAE